MATHDGIRPGLEGRVERVVEGALITRHVGGQGVFATPAMIGLMEWASHQAVVGLLSENETTVGYEVHVRHLAPAKPGSTVVATGTLTEVKGNKLYFDVECRLGDTVLGSGTHKRAIVPASF
ncbi:MAG TPA: hotdog domain-containing protein [Candidatus Dormibacteraeota bacterium]|nr:hotdog domain-containing protein [Candidatus Dormibacteraeota bacterium]